MAIKDLLTVTAPAICAVGGTLLLLLDLAIPRGSKSTTAWAAFAVILLALASVPAQWGVSTSGFAGMVAADGYSLFVDGLLAVIAALTVLLTLRYNEARGIMRGEFYPLMLFALSGMMLMGHATNLIIVFIAVELLSIPLYVLCGFARPRVDSEESALKYFLLGAFASGFLVYGIALIYGAAGTVSLTELTAALSGPKPADSALLYAGVALVLVGLGFKVAAAPFHMWTPDVYEGAPTTVTAFMASATKAAGFAAILRIFLFGLAPLMGTWQAPIAVLALLSMIVGNVVALAQTNLKRMLAYSSIAHAGYVLTGVAAGGDAGASAVLFYLASYALTSLAAFAVMIALNSGEADENHSLDTYAGLGRRKPLLAFVLAVSMLSLLGIPPTAGFFGKYFLISAAIGSVGRLLPARDHDDVHARWKK
ncbi:MAG: NADH-quinone oxidoreductase subunit N [Chloroflexi bacterium]|nr:NADH-quinone oxidoreductase subunit N [Chloroflexota bacterium]